MLAVSKNRELVELCITVFKEVTNSAVQNVIDDQVHKSVSDNVLYIEQLVAGMRKPDKSAPVEPSAKSLSKADVEDFLTNIKSLVKKNPLHAHTPVEKVKDPKDSAEPHKAEREAHHPNQSSYSNSVPPASADMDMVMADMAKNVDHMETELHSFWAMDESSLFHTVEELQQELLLPFGSMEAKSTPTLMSLYNAATVALTSHLFSVHKIIILHIYRITLLSPQAYDTKDIDMPMAQ
uniref:Uncharacterized protein n=1 Tax=Moniliophthora roreri TaxID=221103 RepID=A0A0W0FB90_MONRR